MKAGKRAFMNNGGIPRNLRIDGRQTPDIDRDSATLKVTFTKPRIPAHGHLYLR